MSRPVYFWIADWNLSAAQATERLGGKSEPMMDTIGATAGNLPLHGQIRRIAAYITGSGGIAWTPEQLARARAAGLSVILIDQSDSTFPRGDVKDAEPGASSNASAVGWARNKIGLDEDAVLYTFEANYAPLRQAVLDAGLRDGGVVGYQYASPSSNPGTTLPGTRATLKDANADLSVVLPWWRPPTKRSRHPHPKVTAAAAGGAIATAVAAILNGAAGTHVHLTPAEVGAVTTAVAALAGYLKASGA